MSFFKTDVTVDVHEVDFNGVCRASSVMRYLQSTAQSQLTANGMSYDTLRQMNRAFIISKIKIDFSEPVHSYDKLEAHTFPCESRGYSFLRCYKLMMGEATVARAVSVWALIDTEKHSLVKVNDFNLGLPTLAPLDLDLGHISVPSDIYKVGEYRVNYADVDQNRHMNNTKYPDMYSNFLPLEGKRIRTLAINYMNEAPAGCVLDVMLAERDGVYYFKTVRPDGAVNSVAEITLTDIE